MTDILLSYVNQIILQPAPPAGQQVETGFAYVIAAFTVVWLFIAAYLFWLYRRQESLRREVEMLRQEEAERLRQSTSYKEPEVTDTEYRPRLEKQEPVGRQELGG